MVNKINKPDFMAHFRGGRSSEMRSITQISSRYSNQPPFVTIIESNNQELALLGVKNDVISSLQDKSYDTIRLTIPRGVKMVNLEKLKSVTQNTTAPKSISEAVEDDIFYEPQVARENEGFIINACLNFKLLSSNPVVAKDFHPCKNLSGGDKDNGSYCLWGATSLKKEQNGDLKNELVLFYATLSEIEHFDAQDIQAGEHQGALTVKEKIRANISHQNVHGYFLIPMVRPDMGASYYCIPNLPGAVLENKITKWMNKAEYILSESNELIISVKDRMLTPIDQWGIWICEQAELI